LISGAYTSYQRVGPFQSRLRREQPSVSTFGSTFGSTLRTTGTSYLIPFGLHSPALRASQASPQGFQPLGGPSDPPRNASLRNDSLVRSGDPRVYGNPCFFPINLAPSTGAVGHPTIFGKSKVSSSCTAM